MMISNCVRKNADETASVAPQSEPEYKLIDEPVPDLYLIDANTIESSR
jgi:hypothetical protein